MAINNDAKFEKEPTCALKNEELKKFSAEHVWKFKKWNFDGILLSKVEKSSG